MMLKDFLRYPGVFKKSVWGKMCLFYRFLKLCPRENFLKMLRFKNGFEIRDLHYFASKNVPLTISQILRVTEI